MFISQSALVIDKNRRSVLFLQRELLCLGFVVTACSRMNRLQDTLQSMYRVDVVFLGFEMPSDEGEKILQLLRQADIVAPIITYTYQEDALAHFQRIAADGMPVEALNGDCLPVMLQQILADDSIG